MKKLILKATIPQEELKRFRQRRPPARLIGAALVLALVWVFSGVSLSPSRLKFGSLPVGIESRSRQLTLVNHGSNEFQASNIKVLGQSAADFRVDSHACDRVPPGGSCVLFVEFLPQEPGEQQARLAVTTSDGQETSSDLEGMAIPASITVSPGEIWFEALSVGQVSGQRKVLMQGEGWFHVHSVSLDERGESQFTVNSDTCLSNSSNPKSCEISVSFEPKAEGDWNAKLVIEDDAVGAPHRVNLHGVATHTPVPVRPPTSTPTIRVEPGALDFSSNEQKQRSVRVSNDGNAPLRISISVQGEDRDRFAAVPGTCGVKIPAGRECTIEVNYKTKFFSTKQRYNARLEIEHNAPNMTTQSIALRWERIPPTPQPHVSADPRNLRFTASNSNTAEAVSQSQTVTITNDGPVALKQLTLRLGFWGTGEKGPFSHSNNCHQLELGQKCSETVSYSSIKGGRLTEKLYIFEGTLRDLAVIDLENVTPAAPLRLEP